MSHSFFDEFFIVLTWCIVYVFWQKRSILIILTASLLLLSLHFDNWQHLTVAPPWFHEIFFLSQFSKIRSSTTYWVSSIVQCTLQFNEKNSRSVSIVVLQIPCHPLGFDEIFSISFFNWCNIIVPIIFSEFSIQWCFHEIFCCSQVATTTKTTLPFFTITDGSLIERTVARRWRRRRASELMFSHTWQARDAHIM